jgi:cytochrome c
MVAVLLAAPRAQTPTPQPTPGAEAHSVWDGVYTPKQAERGEELFHKDCSTCHGEKLTGKPEEDTPPLAGQRFTTEWNNRPVGDLFKKILRTMPQDDPGSLNAQQSVDLVAFILSVNVFPAGDVELPSDDKALAVIRIEAKPKQKLGDRVSW